MNPEVANSEESLPELTVELLTEDRSVAEPETPATPVTSAPVPPAVSWIRLAYALEFLIALNVILNLWSEIGGQVELDSMPWYIKLACIGACAWCCVRFTAGIVEQNTVWTRRTITWLGGILLTGIVMGGVTYYYHLHGESDDDDDATASVQMIAPGVFLNHVHQGRDSKFPSRFLEHARG